MKILLVSPPAGFSYASIGIRRPPLGLAYIASVLVGDHHVKIVDFNVEHRYWRRYQFGDFDIVGVSVDTSRYNVSLKIARLAKSQGPVVVMGGPHVSFMDREALDSGAVDYVVRNEGELAFLSLVDFLAGKISFEDVRGVSCYRGGEYHRTPDAPFIQDLDSMPFPARDLLPLERYREKMDGRLSTTLVTSRGCPFNCHFCSSSQFFGVRWRARSVENVAWEIELLYDKYRYRAIQFVEDNFTLDPDRAVRLSEEIIRRRWDLIFGAWSRVDTIVKNPEMVRIMARAGFRWTFIGFESGTQEMLDEYGKKAAVQDSLRAMEILKSNGVGVTGSFILGAPSETKEMIKETVRYAKVLNPERAQFSLLTPYPGTRLYQQVKDRLLTGNWQRYSGGYPTIRHDHLSARALKGLLVYAYTAFYARWRQAFVNMPFLYRAFHSGMNALPSKFIVLCRLTLFPASITLFRRFFKGW
jgi:anaerobic magnesium-protoporphyrin IX monomethyl ester cyclase